jgi:hypothetical protein
VSLAPLFGDALLPRAVELRDERLRVFAEVESAALSFDGERLDSVSPSRDRRRRVCDG